MIVHGPYQFGIASVADFPSVYRLRYQVYVTEFGYESRLDHPQGLETDPWDGNAIHFLCRHEGAVIGTLRLILDGAIGLPIERAAAVDIVSRPTAAEISRLAVAVDFRKAAAADPIVVLGLLQIMYQTTKRLGITHWYMIGERWLAGMLDSMGFQFRSLGHPVRHHGWRTPYIGVVRDIEDHAIATRPEIVEIMVEGLEPMYRPTGLEAL